MHVIVLTRSRPDDEREPFTALPVLLIKQLNVKEGVNGVNRLATKGEKMFLTTDKTRKKSPTSDKTINCEVPTTDKARKF